MPARLPAHGGMPSVCCIVPSAALRQPIAKPAGVRGRRTCQNAAWQRKHSRGISAVYPSPEPKPQGWAKGHQPAPIRAAPDGAALRAAAAGPAVPPAAGERRAGRAAGR